MPAGPQGQRRPADTNACAVHVCRIATGEIKEDALSAQQTANSSNGRAGGKARASILSPKRRSEIARKAARARWEG